MMFQQQQNQHQQPPPQQQMDQGQSPPINFRVILNRDEVAFLFGFDGVLLGQLRQQGRDSDLYMLVKLSSVKGPGQGRTALIYPCLPTRHYCVTPQV